ncbi:hypothetical protein [Thiocapsa roseopersicina]|uniref:Uncharacterized protein n=1 Tax=Thiocapsa roseopersicina TaxID=1058 RepID=A0A1H3DQ94_THIRO|nr:hypothetical protein [Thiocapsa roseopersicina]SDX68541.1 hypothetical protein SAMN05421783_15510 [Thiocapsa roseopersicina]
MDPFQKAADRVTAAQQALDEALAAGTDTTAAREALQLATEEVARIGSELARQRDEDMGTFLAEIEAAGAEMAAQTAAAINARMVELATIPAPTVVMDPGMAARAVKAEREAAAAAAKDKAHRDRIDDLKRRLAALEAERATIAANRKPGGRWDSEDARKLALLAADHEGVSRIVAAEAKVEIPTAGTGYDHGAEWAGSVNAAKAAALLELCRTLEARLLEVATQAKAAAPNGDLRMRYVPSPQLARVVAMGVV